MTRFSALIAALTLAAGTASAMTTHVVDSIGDVGIDSIVRFAPDGLPVIAYLQAIPLTNHFNLKVAKCAVPTCQSTSSILVVAPTTVVALGDMQVGADGRPLIAFSDDAGPRLMRCGDPACASANNVNPLEAPPGWIANRIGLAPNGRVFAVGSRTVGIGPRWTEISLVRCADTTCASSNFVTLPNADGIADMAIDADGVPVIAWAGPTAGHFAPKFATVVRCADIECNVFGEQHQIETGASSIGDVRLALVSGGLPLILYSFGSWGTRAALCHDSACANGASINAVAIGHAPIDLIIGKNGLPQILLTAISVPTPQRFLSIAKCGDLACGTSSTVTALDIPGVSDAAAAVDNNGSLLLTFFAESAADLVAATCVPSDCQGSSAIGSPGQNGEPLAVVTSFEGAYINLIDTVSQSVVAVLPVGSGPEGVAISQDGKRAYVTNYSGQSISYLDLTTRRVERTVTLTPQGFPGPRGIAVTPDESRLFVANSDQGAVAIVERASGAVVKSIAVGAGPFGLAMNRQGTRAVVANTTVGTASIIDVQAGVLLGNVNVGAQPYGVAFSPSGDTAYVASFGANKLTVVDLLTLTASSSITVGVGPFGVAVSPDGKWAYVSDNVNQVSVVDLVARTTVASITVGLHPQGVAVTPDGRWLYVANQFGDSVSIVDLSTRSVVNTVMVLDGPVSLGSFVTGPAFQPVAVVEYFHAGFGHYFVTADADEIALLDQGYFAGWARTGQQWKVWREGGGLKDVCRFFTVAFAPKSSHFYTANPAECALVKQNPDWQYEKIAFRMSATNDFGCAIGIPLYRLYNNGMTGAPNHRYTTSPMLRDQMIGQGFVDEGIAGCVPQQ